MKALSVRMQRRFRLAAVTAAVATAHLAAVALLCLTPRYSAPAIPGSGEAYVVATLVSAVPAQAMHAQAKPHPKAEKPPRQPRPDEDADKPAADGATDTAQPLSPTDALALADFQPQLSGTATGPGCNLTQALNDIFVASPEVRQSLDELPVSQRSVANAVMLWDGRWSQDTARGGKALLRALLIKAVAGARPECLATVNHGPVLFYVPDAAATVVIAVGSGDWRWGDLILPSSTAIIS